MVRDSGRGKQERGFFGRIDPFCWFLVVSVFFATVLVVFTRLYLLAIGLACLALLILLFDGWINRPEKRSGDDGPRRDARAPERDRRPANSASRPSARRPATTGARSGATRNR